ncbi:DsbA family protein [Actinomadura chokoriensis]|uniref:DsbA family protein n=1 Tax=Actinomadura chokoriensis TaxID=454156 RepID=UPI0031F8B1BE
MPEKLGPDSTTIVIGDPDAKVYVHLYEDPRCPYCKEYHAVLYRNQPAESTDGFTDERLLELASKVDGLRGEEFDAAIATMKYKDFVEASQKAYEMAGTSSSGRAGPGTPTVDVNGTRVPPEDSAVLYTKTVFATMLTNYSLLPREP